MFEEAETYLWCACLGRQLFHTGVQIAVYVGVNSSGEADDGSKHENIPLRSP